MASVPGGRVAALAGIEEPGAETFWLLVRMGRSTCVMSISGADNANQPNERDKLRETMQLS